MLNEHAKRNDSAVYAAALRQLRLRHPEEFERIRKRLLKDANIRVIRRVQPSDKERTLEFIKAFRHQYKCSPTYREISKGIGLSSESIRRLAWELVHDGKITIKAYKARSIEIVNDDQPIRVSTKRRRKAID